MDQFLNSIRNLHSLTTVKYSKKLLSQVLQCLRGEYQVDLKMNALLLLVHLGEQLTKELDKDDKLLQHLKNKSMNEQDPLNNISLECVKYFGTVQQVPKYKELLDQLIETYIDIPNSYTLINKVLQYEKVTPEQLHLQQYNQILYDHQLDMEALKQIIQNQQTIDEKHLQMFTIYKTTFADRILIIDRLLKVEDTFTSNQLSELQTIQNEEEQYILKISLIISGQQQKQSSILVIENPGSDSQRTRQIKQINPFLKAENELRDKLKHYLQQYIGVKLPPKNHNGQIVKEYLQIEMDEKQLTKLKKACIRNKQILFDSVDLQVGVTKKLILKEELNATFLQLNFFIGNKQQKPLEKCEMLFEEPRGLKFWLNETLQQKIERRKQVKLSCLVAYEHLLFEPIKGQFSWEEEKKKYEAMFMVPCLLSQFMYFVPTNKEAFKMLWRRNREFCHRSEQFALNQRVIKSVLDFKKYIPNLCYLKSFQEFVDGKDLKLGGEFILNNERMLIKLIIRVNMDMMIKVLGLYGGALVVKCFVFILNIQ